MATPYVRNSKFACWSCMSFSQVSQWQLSVVSCSSRRQDGNAYVVLLWKLMVNDLKRTAVIDFSYLDELLCAQATVVLCVSPVHSRQETAVAALTSTINSYVCYSTNVYQLQVVLKEKGKVKKRGHLEERTLCCCT